MLRRFLPLSMLCLLMITALAAAQDQTNNGAAAAPGAGAGAGAGNQAGGGNGGGGGGGGGGGFGGGGGRRGGGNFDPAQFRQRMMDNIKEQLGATDDEWQVLQPKIEKVMTSQRDVRAGMGFRRAGGGGGGGPFGATDDSPVAKATQDLRDTLDNKDSTPETITQKLSALRDARTKAQANLTSAQKDLKDVLTQRQEAALVMMGMLE
jgi:peptidoglycan hydrolase CwlO-like protein